MTYLNASECWTYQMGDMKSSIGWAIMVQYWVGKLGKLASTAKRPKWIQVDMTGLALLPLADLKGACRRTPPLRVQIRSFWHTKFSKRNRLGSPHSAPSYEVHVPCTGNPKSATAYSRTAFTKILKFSQD